MAIDVITQGGGEGLVYAFNAVASIFNGKRALGASLVYIAGSFATVLMVMTMVAKQELLPTIKWFFGSLMITSALMVPKVDIIVKDRLTHLERPVSNVPFMLGTFAGIASQLGDILAKQMDAIFSKAGPDYRGNGVAMASQLLAKVNHFHIRDPLMASNVRGFVQQCMVFDIAKGKYTIKELHRTDDVWKLLKDNASPARGFVYKKLEEDTQKKNKKPIQSKIVTCLEGANSIEQEWTKAYKEASIAYGSRLYLNSTHASKLFLENLPLAHQYLTKLSHTAEQILQQSMMSNAIDDGLLELNQLTDANAAVTAYAAKRAQAQQRVAYSLQGNMASLSLSVLKVVVEILFYGLFPIIVAISIFPGGWMIIKKYLIALFWIQSWAPMYAILNMIMNVYGKAKSTAAITSAGKGALNMYALRGLSEANDWIASAAGYTMMSVPFLSYGIIHYGAGALSQLSTHFGSVTQSAASHAAEEATTGNYSMGNTNFDSHSRHNISGFKHDTNAAIAANKTSMQNADGSLSTRMPNGQGIIDISPAIPKINSQIRISDSLASSFNESANRSQRAKMFQQHSVYWMNTEKIEVLINNRVRLLVHKTKHFKKVLCRNTMNW
jgi:conjugal transfer mating pair stabilization protein TraG